MRKFKEWLSVLLAKKPGRIVLSVILLFNILFFLFAAFVISALSLSGTESMSFLEAAYYTITMILDAGCISFVVQDIGQSGVVISIICLCVVLIGMITFTGAVIGYITNYISSFIEKANAQTKKVNLSNHVVILNWSNRASEIVNDLLYCDEKQRVVILVSSDKKNIEKEIEERLSDTVARENALLKKNCKDYSFWKKRKVYRKHKLYRNVTYIVKEGDIFSSRQLHDISLEYAKTIIILENDINNTICKFEHQERMEDRGRGNSQTVKILMQVSDITADASSMDNQKIIVEVTDDWTWEIVDKIIKCKQVDQKCQIVPVRVNRILGQILSQFSLMPELNLAYKELFSNKGATFFTEKCAKEDDYTFIRNYLKGHKHAIPLTIMEKNGEYHSYFSANHERNIQRTSMVGKSDYTVSLKKNYWLEHKNVIILGHNSKCRDIMQAFCSFRDEWNFKNGEEILRLVIVDDKRNLEKMNYYREYPFVLKTVCADIYEKDLICSTIEDFVSSNEEDTSVLILSSDEELNEDIDANALANLIYVQDIINRKIEENPNFDRESIDVIVEIIDPKHHDIVNSYSVNNVVISNRYISKMITQIGMKQSLFDFYTDILSYDSEGVDVYDSKEIYVKKVSRFFDEVPASCTAEEFIRAVYAASTDSSIPKEEQNPSIVLGYVKPGGKMVLFEGNQSNIKVNLDLHDKLILFSNH